MRIGAGAPESDTPMFYLMNKNFNLFFSFKTQLPYLVHKDDARLVVPRVPKHLPDQTRGLADVLVDDAAVRQMLDTLLRANPAAIIACEGIDLPPDLIASNHAFADLAELWLGGEDDLTSGWMRATSPGGDAGYEGRVNWSGELGFGVRDPEQGQHG